MDKKKTDLAKANEGESCSGRDKRQYQPVDRDVLDMLENLDLTEKSLDDEVTERRREQCGNLRCHSKLSGKPLEPGLMHFLFF
jgi:hypothetical protein